MASLATLRGTGKYGDDFQKFAQKLERAEKRRVRQALTKGLREIARPVGEAGLRAGAAAMPKRGGLSRRVERSSIRQTNSLGSKPKVTIALRSREGFDLPAMDRGELRHPTFGHRPWVRQGVPAGAFSEALNREADKVRDQLKIELERVIDEMGD